MTPSPLTRKLLRDLWHIRGQAIAIAIVVACGVAILVMSRGVMFSLEQTRSTYYERQHFANVFAHAERAPAHLVSRIRALPGVRHVEDRIVAHATLDMDDMPEPAHGRLISLGSGDDGLNAVVLRDGALPHPDHPDEVLALEAFAEAHGFRPGATLAAVINGRRRHLTITGTVLSPEFIYSLGPGQLMPDNKRFGVLWMNRDALAAAFDMEGAFNDISLTLLPHAQGAEVIRRLDILLDPFGGTGAHTREDQISHAFLDNELRELEVISTIIPPIFLGVAMFLLHIAASRLIATEREQIGLLKAFGYRNRQIGWHYMQLVLGIAAVGVVLGWGAGGWLGEAVTRLYTEFFKFPLFYYHMDPNVFGFSAGLAFVLSAVSCLGAVHRAATLPPAVAMAPPPPPVYNASRLERLPGLRQLTPPGRMILRHITRWPVRSALTVTGISMSVTILIGTLFFHDSIDAMIDGHFFNAQRHNILVTFVEPKSPDALDEIASFDGVLAAEPIRAVPVRFRFGSRTERVTLTGLGPHPRLLRLIDQRQRPTATPEHGMILTDKLAEILGAGLGDMITVEVLEGKKPVAVLPVVGLGGERIGKPAYVSLEALNRLMDEGPRITGAVIQSDPAAEDDLFDALKAMPGVVGVSLQSAANRSFRDTMAETIDIILAFYLGFGAIIAGGTVYNSARISLSERGRELASLRVLGFTRAEVSFILLGEIAVLTAMALPLGCVFGYGMAAMMAVSFQIELFRLPLVVAPDTFGMAVLTVSAAALVAGLLVRHRIDSLDLIEVLKTRE